MTTTMLKPEETAQRIEAGRAKLANLASRAAAIGGQVTAAKAQLEELRAEAVTSYGTSNLDELRQKFIAQQEADTAAVLKFERELTAAEAEIATVEQALRVAGA